MNTTRRRYRGVVLVVALLTASWMMVSATAALAVADPCFVAFSDDMESGDAAWSATAGVGTDNWVLGTANPNSPTHAWFATGVATVTDQYLTTAAPVALHGPSLLRFWHDYDLEATFDGGVVEISIDGGATWTDLGPLMTVNGYTETISLVWESPIAGRDAFSGDSGGYIMTEVDLAGFDGTSAHFRFRLATDNSIADVGWFVDDVTVLVNSAPVAHPDAYSVDEDQLLMEAAPGVLGNDSDAEGDAMRAVLDTGPSFGTLFALNLDGSFRYEPNPNYNGPDRFSYHTTDGYCDSDSVIVDITVDPVNDRPVAHPDDFATPEDVTLVVVAPGILDNDTDVEGDTLTPEVRVDPAHGTLTAFGVDGSFMYEPDADFNGTDSFGYRVSDGVLNSALARVTIEVGAINDAPIAVPDEYRVLEDETLTIVAPGVLGNDTDVDGDELMAYLDVAPADGDLTTFRRNGSFVYEPDANFNGTDYFGYHANDGTVNSNMARVTIIVIPVNDVPVAVGDEYSTDEGERLVVGAPGILRNDTDADGDTLRAVLVDSPPNGDLTAFSANGAFTYVPDMGFSGVDGFTYYASDGTDRSSIVRVIINVIADNEAPVAVADEYDVAKNGELVIAAPGVLGNDSDPDGDPLEAVLDTAPNHGTLTLNANGSFTYEPDGGFVGVDGFRYHADRRRS